MKYYIYKFISIVYDFVKMSRINAMYLAHGIPNTVQLGEIEIIGCVHIGEYTYINKGTVLSSGKLTSVSIGRHCAIGRYVTITSKSHAFALPTSDEDNMIHQEIEADVSIGNYVWIGDKAFIRHGVKIGAYAIIGANSVVISDVKDFEVVAGSPAKHIRFNKEHYRFPDSNLNTQ